MGKRSCWTRENEENMVFYSDIEVGTQSLKKDITDSVILCVHILFRNRMLRLDFPRFLISTRSDIHNHLSSIHGIITKGLENILKDS